MSTLEVEKDLVVDHVDISKSEEPQLAALEGRGIVKSKFDDVSIKQVLWLFRRASFYCFLTFSSEILNLYAVSMSGSIIVNKGFIEQMGELQDGIKVINTSWISAWGAVINVGQIIAMCFIPHVADRYGRKKAFYLTWVELCLSLVCLTVAKGPGTWFAGKLFIGMGVGSMQLLSTPYVMEIAPTKIRGGLVAAGLVWQAIGGLLNSVMMQVTNDKYPYFFRLPVYILWGPLAGILICYLVIPESPWWLAKMERKDESIRQLKRLYDGVPGYDFEEEYGIMLRVLTHEKQVASEAKALKWADVFKGLNRKRLYVMCMICCGTQLAGIGLVGTYGTYFWAAAGFSDPFLVGVITGSIGLVAVTVEMFILDKIGRRLPMCISISIMCLMLWAIGAVYYARTKAAQVILVLLISIYSPAQTVWANTYFLFGAELPTAQLRMKTGAVTWVIQAVWGIATSFAVPPLINALNVRAAFVFGALSLPVVAYAWYALPETKGRSVSEIDELYERNVPAWRWSGFETEAQIQLRAYVSSEPRV